MKTILLTLALLLMLLVNGRIIASPLRPSLTWPGLTWPGTDEPVTHKLTIIFTNVAKRTGMIYIGLVRGEENFNGNFFRKTRIAIPASGEVQVSFDNLPAGQYAIQSYQDLNDNMKLDKSGVFPTEPVGFSNLTDFSGPISFKTCSFDVSESRQITVNLINQ